MSTPLQVYHYPKCSTCKLAIKSLKEKGHELSLTDIFEHPPGEKELAKIIHNSGQEIKKFFNTSGLAYKEENVKDKLPSMTEQEKIKLLSSNGRLIKRPIVTDGIKATVGYKEPEFEREWG